MIKKSGFISIVGKPNVGKSTLINSLVGQKVAIVSPKVQTTRHRIMGILNEDDTQFIFVDTPGMHEGYHLLGKTMDKVATQAMGDVDVILYVVDRKYHTSDANILKRMKQQKVPVFLVINKIDLLPNKHAIDEIIVSFLNQHPFEVVIPISAKEHENIVWLKNEIKQLMPEGVAYFGPDDVTDQKDTVRMSELIRERVLFHAQQEVPHSVAVMIERIEENDDTNTLDVDALIIVERSSQKGILIGKGGEKLKIIGTEARKSINALLNRKVHLTLWIKVKKDWRNQAGDIKRYGYGNE